MAIPQSYGENELPDALRELYDSIMTEEDIQNLVDEAVAGVEPDTITVEEASYVDRGDPASADFAETDLTLDGTWRELDLSTIVPTAADRVLLSVQIDDTSNAAGDWIHFRDSGNSNDYNVSGVQSGGGSEPEPHIQDVMVGLTGQLVDYKGNAGGALSITVRGWWS